MEGGGRGARGQRSHPPSLRLEAVGGRWRLQIMILSFPAPLHCVGCLPYLYPEPRSSPHKWKSSYLASCTPSPPPGTITLSFSTLHCTHAKSPCRYLSFRWHFAHTSSWPHGTFACRARGRDGRVDGRDEKDSQHTRQISEDDMGDQ